jgi:hydroxymethylbilane synthase
VTRRLIIGTRGSRLALRQTGIVVDALRDLHGDALDVEIREIKTEGDRSAAPLTEIGGLGVFTKAIEDALLAREIDVAVHSLKDLPPALTDGLVLAAIPPRGDVRDALVARDGATLAHLPPGARIGTGSERRAVQLRRLRDDIEPVSIRGNVDTRIRKVEDGEYDGAVLAMAGLERLGLAARATQVFSVDEMIPSVGQGALAIQVRSDDLEASEIASAIDHAETRACVTAERAFLERLGAGCRLPVGAYAHINADRLLMMAMVGTQPRGIVRSDVDGPIDQATVIGRALADGMLAAAEAS